MVYEFLDAEKNKKMLNAFRGQKQNWLLVDKKWILPNKYIECCEKINNIQTKPDDIWIVSFPRSGTTMMQELVWLLQNNMDFDTASKMHITHRSPFCELDMIIDTPLMQEQFGDQFQQFAKTTLGLINTMSSPRCIKSHMPLSLLPSLLKNDCKIIYVARNPKDVLVSWYEFNKTNIRWNYQGSFSEFRDLFLNDLVIWCPYWEHIKDAWKKRDEQNFQFVFYEEIIKDLPGGIRNIAKFLEKSYSDNEILKLAEHLDIANFRNNPMVNNLLVGNVNVMQPNSYIRKGHSKDWKNVFTPEDEEQVNEWIKKNIQNTDVYFPFFDSDETLGLSKLNKTKRDF